MIQCTYNQSAKLMSKMAVLIMALVMILSMSIPALAGNIQPRAPTCIECGGETVYDWQLSQSVRAEGAARVAAVCVTGAGSVLTGHVLPSFLQARWAKHVEADGVYR